MLLSSFSFSLVMFFLSSACVRNLYYLHRHLLEKSGSSSLLLHFLQNSSSPLGSWRKCSDPSCIFYSSANKHSSFSFSSYVIFCRFLTQFPSVGFTPVWQCLSLQCQCLFHLGNFWGNLMTWQFVQLYMSVWCKLSLLILIRYCDVPY